jgi:nucleotidyltransferase/DNA polymerase involved in DNA repair
MLKISVIDSRAQRRVVIEGTLIEPWMAELRNSWQTAKADLQGRKLVLDLRNVTRIGEEGESALSELVNEGASISSSGVLTKYLLQQLARRNKESARPASIQVDPGADRGKG